MEYCFLKDKAKTIRLLKYRRLKKDLENICTTKVRKTYRCEYENLPEMEQSEPRDGRILVGFF